MVPLKRVCRYSQVGWTPELTRLRSKVTYTRRRWIRTRRVSAREEFLMTRRLFWTTLSRARAAAWRRLCEETSAPHFWSLYRRVRRGRGDQGVETLKQGEQTITTDSGKAEILAGVFFLEMPTQRSVEQQEIDDMWSTSRPPGSSCKEGFSASEVITAVRRQRPGAAPGRNGIPPRMFRKCLLTLLPCLV